MKQAIADLLASKKFITFFTTLIVAYAAKKGLNLDSELVAAFVGLGAILVGAQGLQDHGKEAAKINAAAGTVPPPTPAPAPDVKPQGGFIAPRLLVLLAVLGLTITSVVHTTGCGPQGPGPVIGQVTIDCLGSVRPQVDALLGEFKALLTGGKLDWSAIYKRAKDAGREIGGCALAEIVQLYLGGTRAPEAGDGWTAHETLEKFRSEMAGGASFKATCARTDGSTSECKL